MGINRDKPDLWKNDILSSVDLYNKWYLEFAPKSFKETRKGTISRVLEVFEKTNYLKCISKETLKKFPHILQILRMCTCPPIARDRLIGLTDVSKSLVLNMENKTNPHLSQKLDENSLNNNLEKLSSTINKLLDFDIFQWLKEDREPTNEEVGRSASIIADRLCGSLADPIIRNAQEIRQINAIEDFLHKKGYTEAVKGTKFNEMLNGTYSIHSDVFVQVSQNVEKSAIISVDILVQPKNAIKSSIPIMIEAKSAGDFRNVNKRRKEEATKIKQLIETYGNNIKYILFLCGYFDSSYLGYEAAEGIDWVWEHRIQDLVQLGI